MRELFSQRRDFSLLFFLALFLKRNFYTEKSKVTMSQLVTANHADPSPVLDVLLHRPSPPLQLASNSPPSSPSNAVPMGKAGGHYISQAQY